MCSWFRCWTPPQPSPVFVPCIFILQTEDFFGVCSFSQLLQRKPDMMEHYLRDKTKQQQQKKMAISHRWRLNNTLSLDSWSILFKLLMQRRHRREAASFDERRGKKTNAFIAASPYLSSTSYSVRLNVNHVTDARAQSSDKNETNKDGVTLMSTPNVLKRWRPSHVNTTTF